QIEAGNAPHACILLVEDEEFVRAVTFEVLRSAGYGMFFAANAAESTAIFRERCQEVQLLITDLRLPDRDGFELARSLTAIRPGLRKLYISGYGEKELARQRLVIRDAHFLAKPFSSEQLLGTIERVFDPNKPARSHPPNAAHRE